MRMRTGICLAAIFALASPSMAQTSPALRDTAPDTWIATDDLDRSVSAELVEKENSAARTYAHFRPFSAS
jgi:hypothetical protein